jgi:hypothetical protein
MATARGAVSEVVFCEFRAGRRQAKQFPKKHGPEKRR